MAMFDEAGRAIREAIDTGQIGTPVAARVLLQNGTDAGRIEACLGEAVAEVGRWLDCPVESVAAQGGEEVGQVSALARFGGGRMALVSAGLHGSGAPVTEINLFGNKGMLAWETGSAAADDDRVAATSEGKRGSELVRASLVAAAPVAADGAPRGRTSIASLENVDLAAPAAPAKKQSPPYGVLLVSGDYTHQPTYADDFAADSRCRLIGVTDEPGLPERRQRLNKLYADRSGLPWLPDFEAALQRDDVDIVSICAEPYRRGPLAVAAARAGKHLYFDKPFAASMQHADDMVGAVRDAGVLGHMLTWVLAEPSQQAREIALSGRLGELRAIHCDVSFAKGQAGTADLSKPRTEAEVPERFEGAESKREMTNTGVYQVAMLHWILGRRAKRVTAATGNFFFAEHQSADMEDFGQMLIEFDGGLTATVSSGRVGWRSHAAFGLKRVCLVGSEGTAVIDANRPRVEVWADVEPWEPPERDPGDPMGMWNPLPDTPRTRKKESWISPHGGPSDASHFLDCLEQGKVSEMPVDIAAAATEVLMAGYRSAATGQVVELT